MFLPGFFMASDEGEATEAAMTERVNTLLLGATEAEPAEPAEPAGAAESAAGAALLAAAILASNKAAILISSAW